MNAPRAAARGVVIIGSGPAGYTAAIYTARAGLRPLVLTGFSAGGALMSTTDVENFPGFPEGVLGPDLMMGMREQAERFGAELRAEDAVAVELAGRHKRVDTESSSYCAHAVIVATGSQHRALGLPHEERLIGRGVSSCATCDGFFFRDQDVAVVGGGDTALEEALFLTRFARSVTVIHRRDQLRASAVLQQRAFANDKIEFALRAEVSDILGDQRVTSVRLREQHGSERTLQLGGLFIAIGHQPRSDLFGGQLDRSPDGHLVVDHPGTTTNLSGVFAAGDVVDARYRQAATAAGSGCMAALDAERYLASLDRVPTDALTASAA